MKLGVMTAYEEKIDEKMKAIRALGFDRIQLSVWDPFDLDDEKMTELVQATREHDITVTTLWGGWPGPKVWDFVDGPLTLGLVPKEYRHIRMQAMLEHIDIAKRLGVHRIATHCGFIPENPSDENYRSLIVCLREIVGTYRKHELQFLFETGQETPITLKRTIEDIGMDNTGVNFDPANLLMYGKANPVDAVSVLGPYIEDVHAKDGLYPTDGRSLGKETPLGEGAVDFPALIKALKRHNFDGPITIEREISGPRQIKDIKAAKRFLETIIGT